MRISHKTEASSNSRTTPITEFTESSVLGRSEGIQVLKMSTFDSDILRGATINNVLRGSGMVFHTSNGSIHVDASDYEFSGPVEKLDDFISHSWRSSRWSKYPALLLVYNSGAAVVASCSIAILIGALQVDSIYALLKPEVGAPLPSAEGSYAWQASPGYLCIAICPLVFLFFLVFWQRIKHALDLQQRYAFLDKLCVDQVNEDRKIAAILGLGSFLRKSDNIFVFWDSIYFTRLWCVYEMASWLHLRKPLDNILFVPLGLSGSILTGSIFLLVFQVIFTCVHRFQLHITLAVSWNVAIGVLMFVIGAPLVRQQRHFTHALQQMRHDIRHFSLKDVSCFCCTSNHRMPGTGEPLRCDRELVFSTIATWFADQQDSPDRDALHEFEQLVRHYLGDHILQHVGPARVPYKWALVMALPSFWSACDNALAGIQSYPDFLTFLRHFLCEWMVFVFATLPSFYCLFCHSTAAFNNLVGFSRRRLFNALADFSLTAFVFLTLWLLWYPLRYLNKFSTPAFIVAWDIISIMITVVLYPELRCYFNPFRRTLNPANDYGNTLAIRGVDKSDEPFSAIDYPKNHQCDVPTTINGETGIDRAVQQRVIEWI